jgi:hypothetical protein
MPERLIYFVGKDQRGNELTGVVVVVVVQSSRHGHGVTSRCVEWKDESVTVKLSQCMS